MKLYIFSYKSVRLYASVDLGILSDITEMHHTTEMRQEKIADIRAQLEEQLTKMDNFIFRVGSRKCTINGVFHQSGPFYYSICNP